MMVHWLLLAALSGDAAAASSERTCGADIAPVSTWVADLVGRSEHVFYGTVTFVEPPHPNSGESYDIWSVEVIESFKGTFAGGTLKPSNIGWGVMPGESAVFFVDSTGRLVPCSGYQHSVTNAGLINEVRRAIRVSGRGDR